VAERVCRCMREINHFVSMSLMLMEELVYKDWEGAKLRWELVRDALRDIEECARVKLDPALHDIERIREWIDKREVRPILRCLEDAFWHMIYTVCEGRVVRHEATHRG